MGYGGNVRRFCITEYDPLEDADSAGNP